MTGDAPVGEMTREDLEAEVLTFRRLAASLAVEWDILRGRLPRVPARPRAEDYPWPWRRPVL